MPCDPCSLAVAKRAKDLHRPVCHIKGAVACMEFCNCRQRVGLASQRGIFLVALAKLCLPAIVFLLALLDVLVELLPRGSRPVYKPARACNVHHNPCNVLLYQLLFCKG